jgi:hypothetical protein
MINTVIIQLFVGDDDVLASRIIYPKDFELGEKKISVSLQVKDALVSLLFSPERFRKSLLIEATLTKACKSNRLHYKSILHFLNYNEAPVVEIDQNEDSEEILVTVWEKFLRMLFTGYSRTPNLSALYFKMAEVYCSSGIRVGKVESVKVRYDKQKSKGK